MTDGPGSPVAAADSVREGRVEGGVFMATGVALLAHILFDVPLWLSAVSAVGVAGAVLAVRARRHPLGWDVVRVGAMSAAAALVAYDVSRLAVTTLLDFDVTPFAAFPHFGAGLIGKSAPTAGRWVAGTAFHVVNAITFGIAYTVLAGGQATARRGVAFGVLFGLGLEAVMLGFYPAWLQIPNLREFVSMSVVGHLAYGSTLGLLAQRGLRA